MAHINPQTLQELLRRVLATRPEEVGCETCYESLGRFVELELEGKDASQMLPLVRLHLERCSGCHDEYQALLTALQNIQSDQPV